MVELALVFFDEFQTWALSGLATQLHWYPGGAVGATGDDQPAYVKCVRHGWKNIFRPSEQVENFVSLSCTPFFTESDRGPDPQNLETYRTLPHIVFLSCLSWQGDFGLSLHVWSHGSPCRSSKTSWSEIFLGPLGPDTWSGLAYNEEDWWF